ncbi:hypothetical protein SCHPADRAFT_821499 [Schizopora paradoxa]|uniref:Uncharacterized protein n=1 Tax=Schizopora paradoxa TaxID=27342 RepID=A0A0H2SK43_9AGAM|nr:hypothetical protein SCHPADRAFT_821499 [Schizopora paradoxa]
MSSLILAYYCSGHGYGHATRVSAFATHLRRLPNPPLIHIVSSAPKHVFSQCIDAGALYRRANIDPVIVQPVAYHVDRQKSVEVLKSFISEEDRVVAEEVQWLRENRVNCVLSDAAYLACKAANAANIPSVLITNFTFDSVYSYLSVVLPETGPISNSKIHDIWIDCPIPQEELNPLVSRILDGYRCAHLLLRLPGHIPIPSFVISPILPSHLWTDGHAFLPAIEHSLLTDIETQELLPLIPLGGKLFTRAVFECPLIVRHPSADIYSPSGRKRVLDYIGVPIALQSQETKILIVSFGGQIFRKPSSRLPSRQNSKARNSPISSTPASAINIPPNALKIRIDKAVEKLQVESNLSVATTSHLYIPGAPPATITKSSPPLPPSDTITGNTWQLHQERYDHTYSESTVCSDSETDSDTVFESDYEDEARLLPDSSWIAIVCGASKSPGDDRDDVLPENFFVAPRDIYMPDLTAVGDVLLGKLGYGAVSECVDACTPFVYVPRPLFIEEHGLRRLLNEAGVGVQLSREQYEAGDWAESVQEAWKMGEIAKTRKREVGDSGERRKEGERMAAQLLEWIGRWGDVQAL